MPPAHPFLREGINGGNALGLDGRDGGRPHALQHDLAAYHQVHGLPESLPESPEMTLFFLLDQEINEEIDFLPGHVALVLELENAHRLDAQGRVHDADLRDVQQSDLASEILAEQFGPTLDLPARLLGVIAEGIGVVPSWNHGDVTRWPFCPIPVLVEPQLAKGGVTLPQLGIRGEPAGFAQIGDLVPVLDSSNINGLPDLGGNENVHVVVIAFGELVLIVLVEHLAEHGPIPQRLAADGHSQILRGLALNLVDDAHPQPDRANALLGLGNVEGIRKTAGNRPYHCGLSRPLHEVPARNARWPGLVPSTGAPVVHTLPPVFSAVSPPTLFLETRGFWVGPIAVDSGLGLVSLSFSLETATNFHEFLTLISPACQTRGPGGRSD